ncbi:hypothetical protein WICMUC_000985 [Wickerhamomyces mucosus]|uniref:A to I editase domain-containing protein n=1 Tax=Wickerhamomyces mucosus TaxID=1378264 RepID=A0A9P8PXM5_9ASCO|nr:hypothetical protein WICMUC_000985 [Wickerhamomyces mucosus]
MNPSLADRISNSVISKFHELNKKGKPVIRSNGVKEWTVLSGIVSLIPIPTPNSEALDYFIDTLAVTTGVKSTSNDTITKYSNGRLLHDCHAEVLALRAFNRFIIDETLKVQSGEISEYIAKCLETPKFKLKRDITFAMYISEIPCGDSSLSLLANGEQETWNDDTITYLPNGVLRGREHYGLKGRVRTKPGRRDSPISLSKSCSDKLAITQIKSLLNGLSSSVIEIEGFNLKWLVVPEGRVDLRDLKRSFHERLDMGNHCFQKIQFLETSLHHGWERSHDNDEQDPSNLGLVYIPNERIHESILSSIKEGFYSKKTFIRKNGESALSRVRLFEQIKPLLKIDSSLTYTEFKARNNKYKELKNRAYCSLGGWCSTSIDDFDI